MPDDVAKSVDLLRAAQAGDQDALARLCTRYEDRVRRLVRKRMNAALRAKAESSDLVHEVMLKVVAGFDAIEIRDDRSFGKWITRVVFNEAVDLARKRVTTPAEDADTPAERAARITDPADRVVRSEERARVMRAIAALPDDQRKVVELRDLDELPYGEIARLMGRATEDAVRMLHRRALVRLTAILTEQAGGPPHS
jgi:RNA polymerase sigma-70 factor (ECF subfamily)